MVHQIRKKQSKWERSFDFREVIPQLRYYEISEGFRKGFV